MAIKAKTNNKIFWKFINSKTKIRDAIPELFTTSDENTKKMTNDDRKKADILAEYFSGVYTREPDWTWDLQNEDKHHIHVDMNIELTKDIVMKKLTSLNTNKSPGPDALHPRVFKEIAPALTDPLFHIYQVSMKTGKIPKEWKIALVSAIYKRKGDKHNPVNYRPISLTSIVCKILESIIRDSLMKYLKANGILSDRQFGFLAGRSTTLQLLRVVDEWTEIIDNSGVIDAIYYDFQKAFDTVPHNRLLEVLEFYGIKGSLLTWSCNFLTNRLQQVSVNGTKSETFEVLSDVPQGSVIGPVLFIIYINIMVAKSGNADIYIFADDLKFYKAIKPSDQSYSLQSELDRLYDWFQYSLLKFHHEKCVVIRFGSGKKHMETKPFCN